MKSNKAFDFFLVLLWTILNLVQASFTELAREAAAVERASRLGGSAAAKPLLNQLLDGDEPVIIATDYVRAYPGQIAAYLDKAVTILGTDGFGRSSDRKSLRQFFEVDRRQIVLAAEPWTR